jgi:3-hydroxybutyryl-CoA dehydrogenase
MVSELDRRLVMLTVVIGTGRMGPGIAAACAKAGAEVRLLGRDAERAQRAARAARAFADGAEALIEAAPIERGAMDRADLVVETIVEDAEVKSELFHRIEEWLGDETILATNTSSFRISDLARAVAHPERFVGFHFLNPAQITPVVEVIPGRSTGGPTTDSLVDFSHRMGKTPLVVQRDIPGFIWNRLQFAMLRECVHLLDEGVADVNAIDAAVSDGLAPRWVTSGPLATADLGGIETFSVVASQLYPSLCNDTKPQVALAKRGERGERFYSWSEESEREVLSMRERNLKELLSTIERGRDAIRPPAGPA